MALVIVLICSFIWYVPILLKQDKDCRLPFRIVALAVGAGCLSYVAAFLLQILINRVCAPVNFSETAYAVFGSFISAALVEEGLKFLAAYLILRRVKPERKVDYLLIFGGVGLGFEIPESVLLTDALWVGIFRGVLAMHIIWQLWMGLAFWHYRQARRNADAPAERKALILTFAVPYLLHGVNDLLVDLAKNTAAGENKVLLFGVLLIVFLCAHLVFQIAVLRKALQAAKESCPAAAEPAA